MAIPIHQQQADANELGNPAPITASSRRLVPLDALRGLIMLLMALDHANFFVARAHPASELWNRPVPGYESAFAFVTRFVTHLAAPGFFFLMGTGMVLFTEARRRAGWSDAAVTRHLVLRGLLLIALQLLVENRAWDLGVPPEARNVFSPYFGVLYALGATMIAGALLRLRTRGLIVLSSLAFVMTEVSLRTPLAQSDDVPVWLRLLLVPGRTDEVTVLYPIVPWLGVAGQGMIFGRRLRHDLGRAYHGALLVGAGALALFVIIRALGGIGNIRPAETPGWIGFLNVVKYPPSLAFILLTLGVDLILLGVLASMLHHAQRWAAPLLALGRGPLLFYIAHLYLYGLIGMVVGPRGTGIAWMYPIWLAGVALLVPLCRWYGRWKESLPITSPARLL